MLKEKKRDGGKRALEAWISGFEGVKQVKTPTPGSERREGLASEEEGN